MFVLLFNLKTIKFTRGVRGIINIYVSALILIESQRDGKERRKSRPSERKIMKDERASACSIVCCENENIFLTDI